MFLDGGGASLGTAEGRITIDVSQAQGALGSLGSDLSGFDAKAASINSTFGSFSQSTIGLAQGMQNVGRATVGLGAIMEAPFVLAAKSALDLESTMAGVNAVMDLTGDQFNQLTTLSQDLGRETVFSGTEVASGIEELGKAGISFQDIIAGAAESATDLAAAGGVDVPKAASVMAAAMQQFNIAGEDSAHVADVLAGAANASLSDINQMGIGLAQVGGVANAAGMDIDETATFMAIMANNGIRGSDAATSMKNAILAMLAPTDKASGVMDAMGVSVLDATGNFKGLEGVSRDFFEVWKDSGQTMAEFLDPLTKVLGRDAVRSILFGMQSIQDEQDGLDSGWSQMEEDVTKVGTAHEVATARMDSTAGAIEKLRGSLDVLAENLGTPLIKAIRGPIEALDGFVQKLSQVPAPILAAIGFVGSLAGAITTLAGGFLVVGGYVLEATARFSAAGIAIGDIIAITARVVLGLTAIGLAAAAVAIAINTNFLGIRDVIQGVLDTIDDAIDRFKLFFSLGKAEAGDEGPQGKGFFSDMAQNISALGRAIDATLHTDISGFFDTLAGGADRLNEISVGLRHAADLMKIYSNSSKRVTDTGKSIEAMGKTIDKIFGTDVSDAFRIAAIGVDAFAQAMDIFDADGTMSGIPKLLESISIGLDAAFGDNAAADAIHNIAMAAEDMGVAWETSTQNGLNPAAAALRTLSVGAQAAGFTGLADAIDTTATAAQKFGDSFAAAQEVVSQHGITGLPNAILALNSAMLATIGIGLPDFMIGAANAMAAFQTAMSNGIQNGLNPFQAALKGVGAAIGSIFGPEARANFFGFVETMGELGGAVQGLISSGFDRVGQMFSEIGTALSEGDVSGALTAIQSLLTDVGAELVRAGQTALDWAINIGAPALAGWAAEQAGNFGAWLKEKLLGAADLAGQVLATIQGWWLEVGQPELTGWIEGGAALIGPQLQNLVQFAGETLAKLVGWILEVGAPQLAGWIQGGADLIGPEIQKLLNFAGETLGKVQGWIAEVGAPQLDGWIRDAEGAIAVELQKWLPKAGDKLGDVAGWILEVGAPIVQSVGSFLGDIDTEMRKITEDPAIVANAESLGRELGTKLGTALGGAIAETLSSAIGSAVSGGGSQAHGADAGPGGGGLNASMSNVLDGFAGAFFEAFTVAMQKELDEAKGRIIPWMLAAVAKTITDILATPLIPADVAGTSPVDQGTKLANTVLEGMGISTVADAINAEAAKDSAANQAAMKTALTTGVTTPAFKASEHFNQDNPIDVVIQGVADTVGETLGNFWDLVTPEVEAAGASDVLTQSIINPIEGGLGTLPAEIGQSVAAKGPESAAAVNTAVEGFNLGDGLDAVMATQISGTTLEAFSQAIGTKIGDAVVQGLAAASGGEAQAGLSAGAGASANIGSQIAQALASSVSTADFSTVGTAIQMKIGEALTAGFGAAQATGPSTAGIDIGSQIALALASAITGSDFTVVSQAIQQKIGESLSGGTGGTTQTTDTSAAAGQGATIGASIAASLANSILGSDFSVVGQAISQKISEAVSTATAAGAPAGLGGTVGQGGGIASGIVASIVASFASADFSGVGTAISTNLGAAITAGMEATRGEVANAVSVVIQTAMVAAESANEAGIVFSQALAGGITATSGTIDIAASTAMTTAVTSATGIASTAGPVGTAFTTAVGAGIGSGTGTVTSAASAMMTSSIAAANGVASGAGTVGTAFTTAVGSGIGAGTGTITAAAQAAITSAAAAAEGIAFSSGIAAGAALAQGIAAGIGQNAGVVAAAAAAVVNTAVAAAEGAGGISSPSKVMIDQVGEPLAEGIAVGIEKHSDLPVKAINRLVGRVIDSVKDFKPEIEGLRTLAASFENLPGVGQFASQISGVADHFESGIKSVKDSMKGIIDTVRDSLKSGREKIKGDSEELGDSASSGFNDILKERKKLLRGGMKDTKGTLIDLQGLQGDVGQLQLISKQLERAHGTNTFAEQVSTMADTLEGERQGAVNAAIDLFTRLQDELERAKKKHRQKGREAGSEIGAGLSEGFSDSASSTTSSVDSLTDQVINTFNANLSRLPEMADAIGQATGDALTSGMESTLPEIANTTSAVGDAMTGGLDATVPDMETSATTASERFAQALNDGINSQLSGVGASGGQVGSALSDGTTDMIADSPIRTAVQEFVTGLTSEAQAGIGNVGNAGRNIGQAFATGVETTNIGSAGKGLVDQVETGISSNVPSVTNTAENAGNTIGGGLESGIADTCKTVNDQANSLTDTCIPSGINSGLGTATGAAKDAGQDISDSLKDGMELRKHDVESAFKGAGTGFGSNLASGIGGTTQNNKNTVTTLTGQIGSINAQPQGKNVGSSFGAGIVEGIKGSTEAVRGAATALVDAAESAARDAGKSESPSRVFMDVGRDFMLGFEMGIEDGTSGVVNAMGQSAQELAALFAGQGLNSATNALNKNLGGYTDSVERALNSLEKTTRRSKLLDILSPEEFNRNAANSKVSVGRGAGTVDRSVTINGLTVTKGSTLEKMIFDMTDYLQNTSGQYGAT